MKIDIEGAEIDMLAGAESVLRAYHPTIVMALHISLERAKECEEWLSSLGYTVGWSDTSYEMYAIHSSRS